MNLLPIGNAAAANQPAKPAEFKPAETAGSLALGGVETAGSVANNVGGSFSAMA